jgi:F-type H+-transporting ATPase subunit delta
VSARTVARRYANALFVVAQRADRLDPVGRDLAAFAAMVAGHPELQLVLQTPIVTPKKKLALIDALVEATGGLSVEVTRLLALLADRDRLAVIGDIAAAFQERVMDAERAVAADVVTAVALTDDRRLALADALGRATGRRVTVQGRVDPGILGGVVARVGSVVFDGSVVGQLDRMRRRLSVEN